MTSNKKPDQELPVKAAPTPPKTGEVQLHPHWDRPMTPRQLAKFLQVSLSTVARQTRAGELPCMKIAGQVRFMPREVLEQLRRGDKK